MTCASCPFFTYSKCRCVVAARLGSKAVDFAALLDQLQDHNTSPIFDKAELEETQQVDGLHDLLAGEGKPL